MTDRLFTDCCYGTEFQHGETDPCPFKGLLGRLTAPDAWSAHFHGGGSYSTAQEIAPFVAASEIKALCDALELAANRLTSVAVHENLSPHSPEYSIWASEAFGTLKRVRAA